jgi:hypothetical protein
MLKQSWKSSVALLMTLGLTTTGTVVPLMLLERPAVAGLFSPSNSSDTVQVPSGTTIRVAEKDGKKIIITPDETLNVTLVTTEPIRSSMGTILIPQGATITGQFQPTEGGTQFVAQQITPSDGTQRDLDARSNILDERETIDKGRNWGAVWKGALVGGAAATLISALVSRVGIFKVLGGAGAGALGGFLLGGHKKAEVIVVQPDRDLTLTLDSNLNLNS